MSSIDVRLKEEQFRNDTLAFIPKVDREVLVQTLADQMKRHNRTVEVARTSVHREGLKPRVLNEGMKTSFDRDHGMCFSTPHCFGESNDRFLEKQRRAENRAIREATKKTQPRITGRKLPWA